MAHILARKRSCDLTVTVAPIWGFPKIRPTILGVPIIRTVVFWGLYWGPPILGNYHIHNNPNNRVVSIFFSIPSCPATRGKLRGLLQLQGLLGGHRAITFGSPICKTAHPLSRRDRH